MQEHFFPEELNNWNKHKAVQHTADRKLYSTDYIKLREVIGHFQSCLFQEGSTQKLKQNHPTQKEEELSLSWDFRLTHLRVQHEVNLHTAYTMQQHGAAKACQSQLLPDLKLI